MTLIYHYIKPLISAQIRTKNIKSWFYILCQMEDGPIQRNQSLDSHKIENLKKDLSIIQLFSEINSGLNPKTNLFKIYTTRFRKNVI